MESETQLLSIQNKLNQLQIFPRRYLRPSLNKLNYIERSQVLPVSEDISNRILCLYWYDTIEGKNQNIIINTIKDIL